jgi:regulator of sigma E protease
LSALWSLLSFLIAIGILVTVHEYGHFIVARSLGVRVLRFSIGFGKPLWNWRRGETEYVLAMLPLGGYVQMLDEREGPVEGHELHRAFNRQPVGRRIAIVAAGPVFNFLFAVLAYWLVFSIGIAGVKPIVGEVQPQGLAAQGGFHSGDLIVQVGEREVATWNTVLVALLDHSLAGERVQIAVVDEDGRPRQRELDFARSASGSDRSELIDNVGFAPLRPLLPAVIGTIERGSAAERAGLREGDRVVSMDGNAPRSWENWRDAIRANPERDLEVEVERDGRRIALAVRPDPVRENGEIFGRIGAGVHVPPDFAEELRAVERYAPGEGLAAAVARTRDVTMLTFSILGNMLVGNVGMSNLSGPVRIAQFAGDSADAGLVQFISFLALISISLGVLNLLPIPILDGGHLLFYLVEAVRRRPVSEAVQLAAQRVGIVLLVGIMLLAFYNDIVHLSF